MPFRPADRLPLLLAEIITVLDRHTIQLQQLNNMTRQLAVSLEKHVDYWQTVRQQYPTSELNRTQINAYLAREGTEINKRLQVQEKIKGELLLLLHQLND